MSKVIDLQSGMDFEEKKLSEEIEERQDFASLVINASLDGVCAFDLNGRYTIWNPALEMISGLSKNQVLGKRGVDLFPFFEEHRVDRVIARALAGEIVFQDDFAFNVPQTGRKGWVRTVTMPLKDEFGRIVGGLRVVKDVTDQRQALDQLRSVLNQFG